jgi:hypothetical protein
VDSIIITSQYYNSYTNYGCRSEQKEVEKIAEGIEGAYRQPRNKN